MKTDRELLELAARAARVKIDKSEYNGGGRGNTGFDILGNAVIDWHDNRTWNPLTSDSDALRLAVKLKLVIDTDYNNGAAVGSTFLDMECYYESDHPSRFGSDRNAATRRAIVRAAAAIGEDMK